MNPWKPNKVYWIEKLGFPDRLCLLLMQEIHHTKWHSNNQ